MSHVFSDVVAPLRTHYFTLQRRSVVRLAPDSGVMRMGHTIYHRRRSERPDSKKELFGASSEFNSLTKTSLPATVSQYPRQDLNL
jgi:hypothetical protein